MAGTEDHRGNSTTKFVWPPRRVDEENLSRHRAAPSALNPGLAVADGAPTRVNLPRSPTSTKLWDAIEVEWLGRTHQSWARRAAAAGWSPDTADSYCARCGTTIGPGEAAPVTAGELSACSTCRDKKLRWHRFVRLGSYEGVLRDAISEVKFERWRKLGADLGLQLGAALAMHLDAAGIAPEARVIVPMGVSARRRVSRGIDHALVLARAAQARSGGRIVRALRRRHGPSQVEVVPSKRVSNVSGVFSARRISRLEGMHIIVIDDVRTTGATMTAACRAIVEATRGGPPRAIWAAVLAVTPAPGATRRSGDAPSAAGTGG